MGFGMSMHVLSEFMLWNGRGATGFHSELPWAGFSRLKNLGR